MTNEEQLTVEMVWVEKPSGELVYGTISHPFMDGENLTWIGHHRRPRVTMVGEPKWSDELILDGRHVRDAGWYCEVQHYDEYDPEKPRGTGNISITDLRRR